MRAVVVVAGALLLGGSAAEQVEVTQGNVLLFYRNFDRLTRKPMSVDKLTSELCIGPGPADLERERERTGLHNGSYVHLYWRGVDRAVFGQGRREFPVGTIVVKEKLLHAPWLPGDVGRVEKLVPNGVGGMEKMAPGYDPEGGDWLYFYSSPSGEFTSGRLDNCRSCHLRARESDFVYYVSR